MREEIKAATDKVSPGEIRIAAIPTVLGMVAALTTPFRERSRTCIFTILSRTRSRSSNCLENLEIDAGMTYLENEPIGKVRSIPLYNERYRLITSADAQFGDRAGHLEGSWRRCRCAC